MNLFVDEIVTPPARLPITVDASKETLARAVVEELERAYLWRAIVSQTRRIIVDGHLPTILEIEPVASIVSLTKWTSSDPAVVVPESTYAAVTRDPAGTTIAPAPGFAWPEPERDIGSFVLTYSCGWTVTPESAPGAGDAVNEVPASVQLMVEKAISFRAGSGLAGFTVGGLKVNVADSYKTDALPREIASIGRAFAYRPGVIAGMLRYT